MVRSLQVVSPVLWALVLAVVSQLHAAPVDLQAEQGEGFQVPSIHWRSNAAGLQTVWLRSGEVLVINICLPEDDEVTVEQVRFSRDGDQQEAVVSIDGQEVGSFNTSGITNRGWQWNEFNMTEAFDTVPLTAGQHTVEVTLRNSTDPWGIEIDQISLSFASNATAAQVSCEPAVTESSEPTATALPEAVTGATTEKPEEKTEGPGDIPKDAGDAGKEGDIIDPCADGSC